MIWPGILVEFSEINLYDITKFLNLHFLLCSRCFCVCMAVILSCHSHCMLCKVVKIFVGNFCFNVYQSVLWFLGGSCENFMCDFRAFTLS